MGQDDLQSKSKLTDYCKENLSDDVMNELNANIKDLEKHVEHITGWRISCTLREYEKADDKEVWFKWPVHLPDNDNILHDIRPDVEVNGKTFHQRDKVDKVSKADKEKQQIIDAYTLICTTKDPDLDGKVIVKVHDFVERSEELFGKEIKTDKGMKKKLMKYGSFDIDNAVVTPSKHSDNN